MGKTVIFSVNGYKGDDDLGYLCVQARGVELYHFGLTPFPSQNPPLRLIGSVLPEHMQCTLYPSPKNISLGEQKTTSSREMLSVAVEIRKSVEQKVKVGNLKIILKNLILINLFIENKSCCWCTNGNIKTSFITL